MTPRAWKSWTGWSFAQIAKALNLGSKATAFRYCAGGRIPEPDAVVAFYIASEGLVTPNDLYRERIAAEIARRRLRLAPPPAGPAPQAEEAA